MSDSVTALVDRIAAGHEDPIRSLVDQIAAQNEVHPDVGDYLHQAGASVAKGALSGTRDLFAAPETLGRATAGLVGPKTQAFAEGMARLTPAHWIARGLGAAASTIEDDPEVQASAPGAAKWLSTTGAGALGQAVPFMATAGAGAAVGLTARGATALTALTGVAANGVQGYEDAEKAGATPEQKFGSMLVNGGLGVLEAAEPALILARWDRRTGGMVSKTLLGAFGISGEKGMIRAAHVLAETATEAGTEGVQQLGGNAYAGLTYDERRQLTDGLADATGGGGFAGALLSVLTGHGPRPGKGTDLTANVREGVDLTGQSGTFAEQTTGAAPVPSSPPSSGPGAAASSNLPESPDSSVLRELSDANKQDVRAVAAPDTPEAKYVQEFASQRGLKVRFVEGATEVHGASTPGTIYVDTKAPLRSVAYHETVHQLGAEVGRLADDLRAMDPEGSAKFEAFYAHEYERATGSRYDAGKLEEEGVAYRAELNAGLVYEALQRPERLRAMLESKPGAWTRIVDAIVRAFQKVGLGVRTSKQRALDALRAEVAGQDASKALDSETAIRVALRIRDAFETLQPRATSESGGTSEATITPLAGSETPETASQTPSDPEVSSTAARATSPAPRIVVAEMPKGAQIGTDLTGEPVYSKVERGDIARPGAGIPQPKIAQPGIFDEVGGLFEKQAYGTETVEPPSRKELLANPAVRESLAAMASEVGTEGVGGQVIRGESDQLGSARGAVIGRTRKTAKAEWWGRRPGDTSPAHVKRAIKKALAGAKLTAQETETVDFLLHEAATGLDPETYRTGTTESQKERAAIQNESKARNRKVPGVPFSVAPRTDSPEFKRWFGESKVVDGAGKPLVVYHGTMQEFIRFMHDKLGANTGAKNTKLGFFFSSSPSVASTFGDRVVPAYLSIKNPLVVGFEKGRYNKYDRSGEISDGYGPVKDAITKSSGRSSWEDVTAEDVSNWVTLLESNGFDGLSIYTSTDSVDIERYGYAATGRGLYRAAPHTMWVAFRPEQIKSATGNRGTFDPKNPDIRFSVAPKGSFDDIDKMGFYSQLERSIDEKMPSRATADQVRAIATQGSKAEEYAWSGLDDWLKGKTTVTKDDVREFLRQNNVRVEEVAYQEDYDRIRARSEADKKMYATEQRMESKLRELGVLGEMDSLNNNPQIATSQAARAALISSGNRQMIDEWNDRWDIRNEAYNAAARLPVTPTPKFSQYQTPGGENYRELLLTLPEKKATGAAFPTYEQWLKDEIADGYRGPEHEAQNRRVYRSDRRRALDIEQDGISQKNPSFTSGHFDTPNVLAHVRFNERTTPEGRRVLFMEEVQSDWHQKGREKGYRGASRQRNFASWVSEHYPKWTQEEMQAAWAARGHEFQRWSEEQQVAINGVPDAPFKSTWHDLAMKRMVRWAAEHGFDELAWTTGAMQIDRYNESMRQNVDKIEVEPRIIVKRERLVDMPDGTRKLESVPVGDKPESVYVRAHKNGQEKFGAEVPLQGTTTLHGHEVTLEDVVGKEIASKIRAKPTEAQTFEGEGLAIGGKGMQTFYDEILANSANKIGKKFGARVAQLDVGIVNSNHTAEPGSAEDWIQVYGGQARALENAIRQRDRALADVPAGGRSESRVRSEFDPLIEEIRNYKSLSNKVHSLPITDEMRKSVLKHGQVRFSVAPKGSFDLPDDNRSRQFNRALLDSFEALRLTPELDSAISRRPGLAYGRAERVQAQTIRGMIDVAKKVGKEKADQFLYALHAPTRNRIIAERSQGKMGEESQPGSGMTTSEARKIAAEGLKNPDLVRLRDMNRRLNRERLDALEQAGLLSKEQRAEWEKFGPDYVPLRTADDPGSRVAGGSLNVAGPESKRAEGRSTIADSPLSFGVSSFAQAVERAERNKVGKLFADYVEQHPGDQWGIYKSKDAIPEGWEVLSLKRDGEPVYIGTSNEAIAAAFKQMDVAKASGVLKVAGVFRRYMHNVIIKYNPPFALSNAFRDMGTAAAKVTITDKAATGARVLKNAPAAMLGSWKALRNEGKGGEWGKWYREARDAGALVGWNELGSFQDVEDAIGRSKRGAILNAIEQANRGVELGTRVALYEAMRAQGKTQEQAALIARDGTTDFARRGNYSSQLSSLYLFANANLQGTASLWRAVAAHPARGTTVLGALVAMGYLASLASRQLGDGWDDIPDYQKRRMGGVMAGGTLYGVPLPYGFDVFYYLGARAEAAANGRAQEGSLGMDVLEAAIQSFSPVQGADFLQTVTPTIGRPLVEIATNKDFAGNPIRPQQSPFDRTPSPRSEQTFASVDPTLKAATQGLNRATGGDTVRPGAIDVSAEDVEHVLKFLGGGLGSNAQRLITAANKWTSGEPVRKSDIPIIRTFMSEVPESAVSNLYYDNLAAIEREVEARKKGEEVLDARALALSTYARNVDGRVRKLRERMKASPELRPTLEPAMRAAMASLNERLATQ